MSLRTQWLLVSGIIVALVSAVALGVAFAPPAVGVGLRAPDFRAENIASRDTVSLSQYSGEVVLINVWATWCVPCEAEMPSIERLYQELKPEGLRVLAVSVDEEGSDVVRAWIQKRHLTFDVLHDPQARIEQLYQIVGVPESFVIDREGRVVKRVTGPTAWDSPTQKALFRRLLAQRRPEGGG